MTREITDDGLCAGCGITGRVLDAAGLCHPCWQDERERQDEVSTEEGQP